MLVWNELIAREIPHSVARSSSLPKYRATPIFNLSIPVRVPNRNSSVIIN